MERGQTIAGLGFDQLRFRERIAGPHVGLGQRERRPRSAGRVVAHDLGGRAGTSAQRDETVVGPAQLAVHPASDLLDGARPEVDDAQCAVAAFVPGEGETLARVVEGVRTVPHPPRRPRLLDRLGHERALPDVDVEPTRRVVDVDRLAVRRESRLLHGGIGDGPLADRAGPKVAVHPNGAVPRHVGRAPSLPRHDARIGRECGIEAERVAPVVEAAGPTVGEVEQPDFGLVDRIRHAGAPDGRSSHGPLVARQPLEVDATLAPQFAVGGRVDERR